MKFRIVMLFAIFVLFMSAAAFAADATANLAVSANVVNTCTVADGTLSFGAYDPLSGTDHDSTGTFAVSCTNGGTAALKLGQGANADTGSTDAAPVRRMANGANMLSYQLYSEGTHTTVWEGATGVSYTGTGASQDQTVYGRITAGQNAVAGNYADTVVITVTY